MDVEKKAAIAKQVEYYFSDANLKQDKFFQDKMRADPEHYLPVEVLLKCNKLKNLTSDPSEVLEAIKDNAELEPRADGTGIRRKAPLPDLQERPAKRARTERSAPTKQEDGAEEQEPAEDAAPVADVPIDQVVVFSIEGIAGRNLRFAAVKEAFKAAMGEAAFVFVDHHDNKVHAEVYGVPDIHTLANKLAADKEFLIAHDSVTLGLVEGEAKEAVHKRVQQHQRTMTHGRGNVRDNKKRKMNDKKGRSSKGKAAPLNVGGQQFNSNEAVKLHLQKVLRECPDGKLLEGKNHSVLLEVLKHHERADEKTKDMKGFTAGPNPNFPETRCFFVVHNDDSKTDFSYVKCVERLQS
eukprot:GILK01001168.1.p1 GENE.GILK01001168.1~~GILK01001168.1.p1  ORF type:complete len:352 (+),score=91.58 GILK01001168.1:53-1108(+)